MRERETCLLLPAGEWLGALLTTFRSAGLELENLNSRSYEYRCLAIPIIMLLIRPKDVPATVLDPETITNGGFTGSDIALDQAAKPSWELPVYEFETENLRFPRPKVYLGATPNLYKKNPYPAIKDIAGGTVYSAYKGLTEKYLRERGIQANVKVRQGKIEGMWRIDPNNLAIMDIADSGVTRKANQITLMETTMHSKVVYIESTEMSAQDQRRVCDLKEKIILASQRRK